MTKIAELKDKGVVVAWSPLGEYADVVALGSKVRPKSRRLLLLSLSLFRVNFVAVYVVGRWLVCVWGRVGQ